MIKSKKFRYALGPYQQNPSNFIKKSLKYEPTTLRKL